MMPPKVTQTVERVRPYSLIALIVVVSFAIVLIIAYGQKREQNIMAIRDERRAQMDTLRVTIQAQMVQSQIENAAIYAKLDSILIELRNR